MHSPPSAPGSELTYFPDEVAVALCVYGAELDPLELTSILGSSPTHAHRKGERKGLRSPPFENGAWIREVRRFEPVDVDSMFRELFHVLPQESVVWRQLAARFEVRVDIAVHTDVGCTLRLAPETVRLVADRCGAFQIYIQAYGDNAV